jgi:hypothetical protein
MTMEMQVPRPLYYLLVTTITQFILAIGAILIVLLTGLLGRLPWSMIAFLLAYNIIVATLVAVILTNNSLQNKKPVLKGGGLVLGHLVGLIVGGFVGSHYGGAVMAAIGAVALYFVVGWLGSKVSYAVGGELDRLSSAPTESDAEKLIRSAARRSTNTLFMYGAVIPALFLVAAIFLKSSGLAIAQYPAILPVARILLIAVSLLSVLIPWLRRSRWLGRASNESRLDFAGLSLSLAPAICGFLLFVAFGMSIAELGLFAFVAAVATTTWGVRMEKN